MTDEPEIQPPDKRRNRKRDALGRMMGLTKAQLERAFELLRRGHRIPAVAGYFGITRQAFYMRQKRDAEFDAKVREAQAVAEMDALDKLVRYSDPPALDDRGKPLPRGEWTAIAWFLERRFGWAKAHEREAAAKLRRERRRGSDSDLDRQHRFRAFVEKARTESEGDPEATAESSSDDMPHGDGEA